MRNEGQNQRREAKKGGRERGNIYGELKKGGDVALTKENGHCNVWWRTDSKYSGFLGLAVVRRRERGKEEVSRWLTLYL